MNNLVQSIGGMKLTGEIRSTWKQTWPIATLFTTSLT